MKYYVLGLNNQGAKEMSVQELMAFYKKEVEDANAANTDNWGWYELTINEITQDYIVFEFTQIEC